MMPTCLTMQTPITSTRGSTVAQGDTGGSGRNICKKSKLKWLQFKIETKNLKFNWKILGRRPLWGRSSWTSFGTVQRGWEPRMSAEYTLNSWCGSSRTRPVVKNVYLSFIIFLKRFRFVSEKRSPGSLAVEWHLGPQASLCSPHSETWRNTPNKAPVLFPTHHTLPLVNFETFFQILWRIFCWRSETSIPATSPPSLLHIGLKAEDLWDA